MLRIITKNRRWRAREKLSCLLNFFFGRGILSIPTQDIVSKNMSTSTWFLRLCKPSVQGILQIFKK